MSDSSSFNGGNPPVRYRTFRCPRCRTDISVTRDEVGAIVVCPDCDSEITVPDYLDFDTPTDYERTLRTPEQDRRDALFSPIRNPNREGIDQTTGAYEFKDGNAAEQPRRFIPMRCRVCETFMQVPEEMLGKSVACPDCGTQTVVTDALLKQQESIQTTFRPTSRGVYDIGAVPEAPREYFQMRDGRSVFLDPNRKEVAPEFKPRDRHYDPSVKPRYKPQAQSDVPPERTELERALGVGPRVDRTGNNHDVDKRAQRMLDEYRKNEKNRGILRVFGFLKRMAERRRAMLLANPTEYLPPLVLRPKKGELVWTLASPPKRAPLFNGTFHPLRGEELWARAGVLVILLAMISLIYVALLFDTMGAGWRDIAGRLSQFVGWVMITPVFFLASSFAGLYFWSVFGAGNAGARYVADWRSEDLMGFLGYGLWFDVMLLCAFVPGGILATMTLNLAGMNLLDPSSQAPAYLWLAVFLAGFWLFFPIIWISTAQSDAPFAPITMQVARSFITQKWAWLQFYLFCALTLWPMSFLWLLTAGTKVFWYVMPIATPILATVFGLLTGRLSWILDDEIRSEDFDD